jgi:hypothetical protein
MTVVDLALCSRPIREERLRGEAEEPEAIFSYITPAQRVPQDHPLRGIRRVVDGALERMSPRFQKLYSRTGRPSIPPEKLIRALVLHVLYTPAKAEAGRGDLRLAENDRHDSEAATSWSSARGLDLYLRPGRVQPRAHTESDPCCGMRNCPRGSRRHCNSVRTELLGPQQASATSRANTQAREE